MANNRSQELLTFAHLQMAAEAFLNGFSTNTTRQELIDALEVGNNHASAFPTVLAEDFADTFEVVAHKENSSTGFSGTLFRSKVTDLSRGLFAGQYTLSLRSTEFVDDAIRDGTGTGDLEIRQLGWALGQIADMEAWYKELKAAGTLGANNGLPVTPFNVTGYSLGGHLATAFAILRRDEAKRAGKESLVAHVYTFNGAGVGGIRFGNELGAIVANFDRERGQAVGTVALTRRSDIGSAFDRVSAIVAELQRLNAFADKASTFPNGQVPPLGDMASGAYQLAALAASRWTTPVANFGGFGSILDSVNPLPLERVFARTDPFANMTEIYGADGGQSGSSLVDSRFSFVSFSGQHYSKKENSFGVYIEDQPLERGNYKVIRDRGKLIEDPNNNSFADTHSLVLMVDSLSLMSAMTKLDPNLTQAQIEAIFKAASNSKQAGIPGTQGEAEGDTLERVLDSLRRIFVGPTVSSTPAPLEGNTWHDLNVRQVFHTNLKELVSNSGFQAWAGQATIKLLPSTASAIEEAARGDIAYRYALRELSPFAVVDAPGLYDGYNLGGELDIFDPASGEGAFTDEYLSDRAAMLTHYMDAARRNSGFRKLEVAGLAIQYSDQGVGLRAYVFDASSITPPLAAADDMAQSARDPEIDRIFGRRLNLGGGRKVLFGFEGNAGADPNTRSGGRDTLEGGMLDDHLYGAGGNDTLRGGLGDDYLEGGIGDDILRAGVSLTSLPSASSDSDVLLGGKGNDILDGGLGTDKYYFYTGGGADEVFDVSEGPAGAKRQLGEIYFNEVRVAGTFTALDADRKEFKLELGADTYFGVYQGDLATATPGKLFLYKSTDGTNVVTLNRFVSGDFGIVLDPNAPQRTFTDKFGTAGADNSNLISTPHNASLSSDAPDQKVFGQEGSDFIQASHANVIAYGGPGNDYLANGAADQTLYGESGRDVLIATAGDDSLYGGLDDDALQGGADKDYLEGNDGNDVLDGGAGEDVIAGGDGNDFIFGGGSITVAITDWDLFAEGTLDWGAFDAAGNVLIRGLAGLSNVEGDAADVITAGAGADWVFAGDGNDAVSGGTENDYLVGQAGADEVSGDEGDDTLYGDGAQGDLSSAPGNFSVFTLAEFHGKDMLDGGAGNDFISGDGEADELYGGEGNDTLVGDSGNVPEQYHGADWLEGGAGNDLLLGYGKDDTLFGGTGDDTLGGDSSSIADSLHGNDYLDGEDGADTLHGDGGADTLFGGTGDDILDGDASNVAFEFHGDDYLEGEEGNDALQGGGGADRLYGGAGNDSLVGDGPTIPDQYAGADYLDGEAGDDILEAGAGNDTLVGGAGVDILRGQAGDDLYLVNLGSQNDFIQDVEGTNTVRLAAAPSVVFQALGSDGRAYLGLRYSSSDLVHIQEGLTNSSMRYELPDGTVKTAADWRASFNQFVFTPGTSGADTLAGSALADSFSPGAGDDTILFGRGSGFDRVLGFGQVAGSADGVDKIKLGAGITVDDILVTRGSLILTIKDTGDTLRIDNWVGDGPGVHTGVQVEFDDGTGLTAAQLVALSLRTTDGNDTLVGGQAAETIAGSAGNDALSGGAGDDTLSGGEGDDSLVGDAGADTLDGGAGNDSLGGGTGSDVYLWGVGDGNDVVIDTGSETNVVQFKPGVSPDDVTLTQGSIVATLNATGETLTIVNWYREEPIDPKFSVQELRFGDGTVWDASLINEYANHATPFADLLRGIHTADTLYGLSGDDTIEGFSGDDVLLGGDGNDVLDGGAGADDLDGGAGNDKLLGGANGDVLDGGPGDDTLDGGQGEDLIYASEGNDTVFASADDVLVFREGVAPADVAVTQQGSLLHLSFASGSVQLVGSVREARFADGTVWSADELNARAVPFDTTTTGGEGNDAITGVAGNDTLTGGAGDDTLTGGEGDDTLDGGPGNDSLAGGFGSDTYVFGYGYGNDLIAEPGDFSPPGYSRALVGERDRILLAPSVGPEDVVLNFDGTGDELISLRGSGETLTISANYSGAHPLARVEFLEFADGTVWDLGRLALPGFALPGGSARHFGTAGNDFRTLGADDELYFGLGGNDSLTDQTGHNTLYGNEANDTLSTGAGDDVLSGAAGNDSLSPRSGDNVIRFGRGAGQDTLTLARNFTDYGSDTVSFAEDVDPDDLRLRRGPNATLIVEIAGTPDSLTIQDDFFAKQGRARLRMQFADGTLWDAAQIEAHIQTVALIEGGTGNNSLAGGDGSEIFVGGPGNDTLTGGGGQDTFVFERGDGTDTIIDEAPRIVLGEGILPQDVTLSPSNFAAGQRDLIVTIGGGGGQITARNWFPSPHAGTIEFADGTVWDSAFVGTRVPYTFVSGGTGIYTGTIGNDVFAMGATADTMRGEGGNDELTSGGGKDQLFGGAGDDVLSGGAGDDNLQGEAGNDTLLGDSGDDTLSGGAGDDLLDGGVDSPAAGETDNDLLSGGDGDDVLLGRSGNDSLTGGWGNDSLSGGAGNDVLEAGAGDDTLDGGAGDDRLYGGSGSDEYLFGIGSGNDTLLDFDATGSAIDTVRIGAGIAPQDVQVLLNGADLVMRLVSSGETLSIRSFGREGYGVERVVFEDGTVWTAGQLAGLAVSVAARERADLIYGSGADDAIAGLGGDDILDGRAGADVLDGGTGDDILFGGDGDDTLDGGAGFDHLVGGAGADTFLVSTGSGSDVIVDLGAGDTLSLGAGIVTADVAIARDRDHLYLEVGASGQFITLENWFANGAQGSMAFPDGTLWDGAFLKSAVDALTDGDDFFVGTALGETIAPLAGLDTVLAGGGDDIVSGGDGSDTLHGESGNDNLSGEAGYDLLTGGDGDDVLDGGLDDDALFGDAGNDSLAGGEGFDELTGGSGNDTLAGGDGDDVLAAGEGADTLNGGAGDDALNGGAGNDIYVYAAGEGSDAIAESETTLSSADTLRLVGLSPSEVGFRRFPTYSVLEFSGSIDTIEIREVNFSSTLVVERIEFDDGTVWNQTDILFQTINVGTEGNDILSGFKGLVGLGGNDTLSGNLADNILDGGDGADILNGSAGNDRLIGGPGNDTLNGGAGNDTYVFGGGAGDDTVSNLDSTSGRRDLLEFTADILPQDVAVERIGNHLRVVLNGGADRLRVDNWFSGPEFRLDEARFADGTVWSAGDLEAHVVLAAPTDGDDVLTGLSGDDTIDGLAGNDRIEGGVGNDTLFGNLGDDTLLGGTGVDTLDGGEGNDSLDGGVGNDLYVFGPGAGFDTVTDVDATAGNVDAVLIDALPGEVTVTQQSPHLVLTLAGGERITLQNWLSGDSQKVEEVRLRDGTVWDVAALLARSTVPILGTEGNDFLQGTSGSDLIDGLGGNDLISAASGSDTLLGGTGNDTLNAGSGNDTLDGGAGDDTLNGDVGDDTYRFAAGYGRDQINESSPSVGNMDVVELQGLPSDTTARRVGNNLEMQLTSGDVLVVNGWFAGKQVELVRFADGTTWDVPMLDTLAYADLPHTGTAAADTLYGTNDSDTLEGLAGNDRLEGRGGDDVLIGGPGVDTLIGGIGNDVYRFAVGDGFDVISEQSEPGGFDVLEFGPGIAPENVTIQRSGSVVFLTLFGGTEQVALSGWTSSRVEEVRFADGTVWDERFLFDAARASDGADFIREDAAGERIDALQGNDVVLGGAGDDELLGNAGDDTLSGDTGADTLDGGTGRDLLQGGQGDDRFVFAAGYGTDWITDSGGLDEVDFGAGLTTSNVVFTRDLSDLFVTAGADRLTLVDWFVHPDFRVESFSFADGTVLNDGEVRARIRPALPTSLNDTIFGSDIGEAISGLAGEDALYGEGGNDTLDGGAGSDYLIGGTGDDTYYVDIRLDRVTEDADEGVDTVIATISYTLPSNVENLTLSGTTAINGTGNTLDNILLGNAAANVLDGGSGNDSLRGGLGNDAYFFRRADGTDEIVDVDSTVGNIDEVRLAAGILPAEVRVARVENDIRLRIRGGGEIHLRNWLDPAYRIESVKLADGTVWDAAEIEFRSTLPDNRPPQMVQPIADQAAFEDSLFEFGIPATTFSDPDLGDELSYAATLTGGAVLPQWLSFDAGSRQFSGTPLQTDVGQIEVEVTATDTWGLSASDSFTLAVANVEDAPIVSNPISDRSAVEDEMFSFVVPEGTFSDEDPGDTLITYASRVNGDTLPAWLTYDPATRTLSGTPLNEDVGPLQALVSAEDGAGGIASDTFTITVLNTNDAPTLATAIADQAATEGVAFSFSLPEAIFVDVDAGDSLAYAANLGGGAPLPDWLSFDAATRSFSGAPAIGDAGTLSIDVIATDTSGASASDSFDLAVAPAGGQGETLIGTPGNDRLIGTPFDDLLDGREGSDVLIGKAGDDVLLGGKDADRLFAGRGDDVLVGGRGDDRLRGGHGADLYLYELHDGHDVIKERGHDTDTLAFGSGITPGMVRAKREHEDLVLDLAGPHGSVTVEGWFASDSRRVERIEFADGTVWDEADIRELVRERPREGMHDGDNSWHGGHPRDDDHHHGSPEHGRDRDRDDEKHDRGQDWIGDWARKKPRFDFEAILQALEDRGGRSPDRDEIARGWVRVQNYVRRLGTADDEDSRLGAMAHGLGLSSLLASNSGGTGWGFEGSVGAARGPGELKSFEGLKEGFNKL